MSRLTTGSESAVLRCARCGRLVAREVARVQAVCDCRPRSPLPGILVRQAEPEDAVDTTALFRAEAGRTAIPAFGGEVVPGDHPAIVAEMKGELAGALAYRLWEGALHVIALAIDPVWQRSGVGSHLLAEAELIARRHGTARLVHATTNDNLPALYFYQRRGWVVTEVVPGALVSAGPGPDAAGFAGIPVRDEVRLAKFLED